MRVARHGRVQRPAGRRRAGAPEGAGGGLTLRVTWLGQAGFLLEGGGRRVVVDPYLSHTLTRKYAGTATPHDQLAPHVCTPGELAPVDVVLATHAHTDHLDPGTLGPLLAASPEAVLIVPAPHTSVALQRAGIPRERLRPMLIDDVIEVGGIGVRAVPAAHEELAPGFVGYVVEIGDVQVFHAGDTVPYEGQAAAVGPVDLALLPINGRGIPGTPGNLDADEAAVLAAALPARVAVPMHFGMFGFNTADPAPFAAACARLGVEARVLAPGERLTL